MARRARVQPIHKRRPRPMTAGVPATRGEVVCGVTVAEARDVGYPRILLRPWPLALVSLGLLFVGGGKKARTYSFGPVPESLQRSEPFIGQLEAAIRPLARELIRRAAAGGMSVAVSSGLRTGKEQDGLYAQGRTAPGPIVTDARSGESWHNFGLAFDLALDQHGELSWPNDLEFWGKLGQIGEGLGLGWGGRFPKPDWGHFEYHPGIRLADARAGVRPKVA